MFILNSIGIFVKLIQEYRGGAYIYSGGKGLTFENVAALTLIQGCQSYVWIYNQ